MKQKEAKQPKAPIAEDKWLVIITCKDEAEQVKVLQDMIDKGKQCRAIVA